MDNYRVCTVCLPSLFFLFPETDWREKPGQWAHGGEEEEEEEVAVRRRGAADSSHTYISWSRSRAEGSHCGGSGSLPALLLPGMAPFFSLPPPSPPFHVSWQPAASLFRSVVHKLSHQTQTKTRHGSCATIQGIWGFFLFFSLQAFGLWGIKVMSTGASLLQLLFYFTSF